MRKNLKWNATQTPYRPRLCLCSATAQNVDVLCGATNPARLELRWWKPGNRSVLLQDINKKLGVAKGWDWYFWKGTNPNAFQSLPKICILISMSQMALNELVVITKHSNSCFRCYWALSLKHTLSFSLSLVGVNGLQERVLFPLNSRPGLKVREFDP